MKVSSNIGARKTFTTGSGVHAVSFDITDNSCSNIQLWPPALIPVPISVNVRDNSNNIVASGSYTVAGNYNLSFTPSSSGLTYKIEFYMANASAFCYFAVDNVLITYQDTDTMQVCEQVSKSGKYPRGMNGQEKTDEVSGKGNHYTAEFWEYDPRTTRRWNLDPKPNISISPYATFGNNPIAFSDPYGDTIKTSSEGNKIIQEGLTATLGKNNPFGYDEKSQTLTFDKDFDKSSYSEKQLRFINDFAEIVSHEKTTTVKVVDFNESIPELNGLSLADRNFNGATTLTGEDVYIARDPKIVGYVSNSDYNPMAVNSKEFRQGMINAPLYIRGVSALHEIGGHARLRFTKPQLSHLDHDILVEEFETNFLQFYKTGNYTEKMIKKEHKAGVINVGDPIYLGGKADIHGDPFTRIFMLYIMPNMFKK